VDNRILAEYGHSELGTVLVGKGGLKVIVGVFLVEGFNGIENLMTRMYIKFLKALDVIIPGKDPFYSVFGLGKVIV
jgi:hypothetical protein